jgi:hypothetical protein
LIKKMGLGSPRVLQQLSQVGLRILDGSVIEFREQYLVKGRPDVHPAFVSQRRLPRTSESPG